MHSTYLT